MKSGIGKIQPDKRQHRPEQENGTIEGMMEVSFGCTEGCGGDHDYEDRGESHSMTGLKCQTKWVLALEQ